MKSYLARHKARRALQSKFRRRATRTAEVLVLLVVIVVGGSGAYVYHRLHDIRRVKVHLTKVPKTGTENILLVGSTSRCAVTPAKNFENFVQQCEDDVNGVNSDVIMILRLEPNHTPMLLSIPRDTFVPDARAGGLSNKVDAALADGPSQLVQAIQQDFGIPINHYVVLNFQTFANIVTALGGITMYFPTSLMDKDSGLYISHSGCLRISGLEALALVRARHLYYHYDKKTKQWLGYDGSGDLGRIERVHIFLKVLGAEVANRGLGDPLTDSSLLSALAPDLTLDTTFGTKEILDLILAYHSKVAAAKELTLPIVEDANTYYYKGYSYGLVVFPSEPQDQSTIAEFTGGALPGANLKPSSISVSVVDGSGSATATAATTTSLRALGYRVTEGGSQTPVGPIAETTVAYSSPAHLAEAERVLHSLSGLAVLSEAPTVGGADVTVTTGSEVSVVSPSSAALSAATTGDTSQRATTSSDSSVMSAVLVSVLEDAYGASTPTNPALTNPTPSAPSIAPYDPRACPGK